MFTLNFDKSFFLKPLRKCRILKQKIRVSQCEWERDLCEEMSEIGGVWKCSEIESNNKHNPVQKRMRMTNEMCDLKKAQWRSDN